MIPENLTLETHRALLRPLSIEDYSEFLQLAKEDHDMWAYFSLNLADEKQLQKWFEIAFNDRGANTRRPFTIIDKQSGLICGSSSLGNISFYDLRAEIGWSWLGPGSRSTGLNKHAKYAMSTPIREHALLGGILQKPQRLEKSF